MEVVHVVCPSCSVGCGINLVKIQNQVVGTYPYKRHPINEGKICEKGKECYRDITNENRIILPSININAKMKHSNWEEALDLVVSKLNSYKKNEIGILTSGELTNEELNTVKKFADNLGIIQIGFFNWNIPTIEVETATMEDVENSKFIIIIGDVLKDNPLIGRRILRAHNNGAILVAVDKSENTFTGLNSDRYLKTESITDFLEKIDDEIMSNLNESSMIIFNKLDKKQDFNSIKEISQKTKSKILPVQQECNSSGAMNILHSLDEKGMEELINNVKLLYVIGSNPAPYFEDSLKKMDFLITQNTHINETVLLSDVVLPSSMWAEKNGTYINTTGVPQEISTVVSSPENVLGNDIIIRKIAEKMGIEL